MTNDSTNVTQNSLNSLNTAISLNEASGKHSTLSRMDVIPVLTISEDRVAGNPNDSVINKVRTTCPYCGVGCGVLVTVNTVTGNIDVQGDPEHPANFGKLCSKGSNLAETLGTDRRLTTPYYQNKHLSMPSSFGAIKADTMRQAKSKKQGVFSQQSQWDTVLEDIAVRLTDTIAEHGADSVMLYVSGQLLTEDYYVANKFVKGFIGSNNIDSNSRLCMSSAVAGHKRAFGADLVPGSYTDFESCDLLVLVGSNMAWCHPVLFGRFLKAKQQNPNKKLIVIDPRRTDSCEFADLHLPLAPGTDTHLYNGLLKYLKESGCRDDDYVAQCENIEAALRAADSWDIEAVVKATQVDADTIKQFYQMVADTTKTVTAFSMGVNQSSSGTDKVNAIINTHLFTGRIGIEGASPFSLTGQPNAMGGREVGALANLLAGHLDLANSEHREAVAQFWQTPQKIASNVGVTACEAADAILDGRIKAIWIIATNPVVSLPEAEKFRHALAKCDLVIVSECSKDSDTIRCADIVLPAQGWGEKSGTVTNSERCISRQRSFLPAVGEAKPDWWILSQVAKRMGFKGFDYEHPSEIFNEHVALTSYKNSKYPRHLDLASEIGRLVESNSSDRSDPVESHKSSAKTDSSIKSFITPSITPTSTTLASTTIAAMAKLTPNSYELMSPFQWGGKHINVIAKSFRHSAPKFIGIEPPQGAGAIHRYSNRMNKRQVLPKDYEDYQQLTKLKRQPSRDAMAHDGLTDIKWPHFNTINSSSINLRLITGRLRDQWHTMTRTGLAPKLNQQKTMPMITLHPEDAQELGLTNEHFVSIVPQVHFESYSKDKKLTDVNKVIAQVDISDNVRKGDAFMPMHWSEAFANLSRVGVVIPNKIDPISSQPELKNSAVTVEAIAMHTVGRILVHPEWLDVVLVQLRFFAAKGMSNNSKEVQDKKPFNATPHFKYPNIVWSLSRQQDSILINIATPQQSMSTAWLKSEFWQGFINKIISSSAQADVCKAMIKPNLLDTSIMVDSVARELRLVVCRQGNLDSDISSSQSSNSQLDSDATKAINNVQTTPISRLLFAVYIAPEYRQLPSTHWLNNCFVDMSEVPSVKWLLAGRPASGYVDPGPIVCACMGVGKNIIVDAIKKDKCTDAVSVGKLCAAGTNCGSCVGQINALVEQYA